MANVAIWIFYIYWKLQNKAQSIVLFYVFSTKEKPDNVLDRLMHIQN